MHRLNHYLATILLSCAVLSLSSCGLLPSEAPSSEQPTPSPAPEAATPDYIQVAQRDATIIGQRIWMNEGSGKAENLVVWNAGEDFTSLGIGHFIWYPPGLEGPFNETFPDLVQYLQSRNVVVPEWLRNTPDCPWTTRAQFNQSKRQADARITSLQNLMLNSIPQQVEFMTKRLEAALPKMLDTLPSQAEREHVQTQFYRVAQNGTGVYALIDYVNFKGEGTKLTERYNGLGWGLLQVLQLMPGTTTNPNSEFAGAAEAALQRRVQNAPAGRNEGRWLPGWRKRIDTYRL